MTTEDSKQPRKRAPRKATPKYLENAALYYLSRYSTSTENLRRVMMRKVMRSAKHHGTDVEDGAALIEAMVSHPVLIQRPIVTSGEQARIGRPPGNVLDIL